MTISDAESKLILFRAVADQAVYSSYYGQITPGYIVATPVHQYRKVKVGDKEYSVPLNGVKMVDEPPLLVEMADAEERQQKWQDAFFKEQNYLRIYNAGQHDEALSNIRSIINKQLLWDLDEIRIVDPYLSPNDILNTVALCEKPNVRVCCLTDIHTISRNKDAKAEILAGETQGITFDEIRNSFRKQLEGGLGRETDLQLSFRTVHGNNGSSFHDRYLILKYQVNKTRVWSLGTSVNSVGKSHHIVQIVESPTLIDNFLTRYGCKQILISAKYMIIWTTPPNRIKRRKSYQQTATTLRKLLNAKQSKRSKQRRNAIPYLGTVQELLDDGTPSILIEHSLATCMENDAKKFITNITKERSL